MFYLILAIAIIAGGYFAFRYFSIVYALQELNKELQDIQKDLAQNQILHLPIPNKNLGIVMCSFNKILEAIRKERQTYEKHEKEFQKQIEGISHDLRTPLTVILGYLKLIKKSDSKATMDKELAVNLEIIERKAEVMKKLVTQFYDFSRLNANDYQFKLDNVDICRTLKEALMGNYQVLEQIHLKVDAKIPNYPIGVMGEETALERIFSNLLQNAGRYASSFLDISINEDEKEISIFFVNDTEILFESDIPHLFDRFYMVDSSRNQGGTGLGLTVAKALAEEMGGTIEVSVIENKFLQVDSNKTIICFKMSLKSV